MHCGNAIHFSERHQYADFHYLWKGTFPSLNEFEEVQLHIVVP